MAVLGGSGSAWAAASARTLARRQRRTWRSQAGISRANAVHVRTLAFRHALQVHWRLGDQLGAHFGSLRASMDAARLLQLSFDEQVTGSALDLGNWAKHAPPPAASPARNVPAKAVSALALEQFRSTLYLVEDNCEAAARESLLEALVPEARPLRCSTSLSPSSPTHAIYVTAQKFLPINAASDRIYENENEGDDHLSTGHLDGVQVAAAFPLPLPEAPDVLRCLDDAAEAPAGVPGLDTRTAAADNRSADLSDGVVTMAEHSWQFSASQCLRHIRRAERTISRALHFSDNDPYARPCPQAGLSHKWPANSLSRHPVDLQFFSHLDPDRLALSLQSSPGGSSVV